jgi:hypothetical protein
MLPTDFSNRSAVFCLSPENGFVTEQWAREESKLLDSRVNAGYCGWTPETGVGWR